MSIVDVKVPQLSESVAEATLMQWKKKVGETVTADEILIEIETDKVVLEVPAPSSGVLSELVASRTVPPSAAEQVIAHIDTSGGAVAQHRKCCRGEARQSDRRMPLSRRRRLPARQRASRCRRPRR